jgi:hypothetical protein
MLSSTESVEIERCPSCGHELGERFVPAPEELVEALPAVGWRVYFWTKPADPMSMETRSEPLAAWGVTWRGEVFPLLTSESPDVTTEDVGDSFGFLARASASHRELRELRREAHAKRSSGSGG